MNHSDIQQCVIKANMFPNLCNHQPEENLWQAFSSWFWQDPPLITQCSWTELSTPSPAPATHAGASFCPLLALILRLLASELLHAGWLFFIPHWIPLTKGPLNNSQFHGPPFPSSPHIDLIHAVMSSTPDRHNGLPLPLSDQDCE